MSKLFVVRLPVLSQDFENVAVSKIHVKIGEHVRMHNTLMEFESSKATFYLQSEVNGTVTKIHVHEHHPVVEGDSLVTILKD